MRIDSEIEKTVKKYFPNLKGESLNIVIKHSSYLKSNKGEKLILEGKRHHYFYLIVEGSVKSFYAKESKEVCTWFAFENEFIGTTSTLQGLPSNESVQLLEDSVFIRFNTQKINELTQTYLSISHLLTNLWEEHATFLEERLYQLQFLNSHERYKALIKDTPEILQRVSLTDIASFLGVSRETLSRMRAKR